MWRGDRSAHPDPQVNWSSSIAWSSTSKDPSVKENAVYAAWGRSKCSDKPTSPKKHEDRPSSWDVVNLNDVDNNIAERMGALDGLGRYMRPPRRKILQDQQTSGKKSVVYQLVSGASQASPACLAKPLLTEGTDG